MRLTKTAAANLVEQARQASDSDNWAVHSLCVGHAAERIATALCQKSCELDPDHVAALGYVHDIGKHDGAKSFAQHMLDGYNYLLALGYDENDASICLTHSFLCSDDPFCTLSTQLDAKRDERLVAFLKNHSFSLEEKLIALCDAMCVREVMIMEERLVDVISRHGMGPSTQKALLAALSLKHEFDDLLGANIYTLFPEIKARFK